MSDDTQALNRMRRLIYDRGVSHPPMNRRHGMPTIGVVTVTYNSGTVIAEFLDTMARQDGVELHVLVIDNASTDSTLERIEMSRRSGLDLTVISNSFNRGLAAANNQGIRWCQERGLQWVVLMNNDVFTQERDLLMHLCDAGDRLGAEVLSPVIAATDPPGSTWFAGAEIKRWRGLQVKHSHMGKPLEQPAAAFITQHTPACCLLIRSEVFERVGYIDEDFFVYGEDTDFSLRLSIAGVAMWVVPGPVLHHASSSLTGGFLSDFTVHWLTRNWVLVHRKHSSGVARAVGFIYIQAWMLARVVARREGWRQFRRRQRAFCEGMRVTLEPGDHVAGRRRGLGVR